MSGSQHFDVAIIGSGPAGHTAALTAARAGRRVLVVERDRGIGGACVQRGTIPSKTLRETAAYFAGLRVRSAGAIAVQLPPDLQLQSLMTRMDEVVRAHCALAARQLQEHGIEQAHGRAEFTSPHAIDILGIRGERKPVTADTFVIATGSRPRTPPEIPVDHEHVLDSDSVLSMMYVPRSLAILGAGVIASEYASIFAALGVAVVMIDKGPRPMGFLDPELCDGFTEHFVAHPGCRYLGGRKVARVAWDGVSSVVTELADGEVVRSEKMLCALGRVANLEDLHVERAGIAANARGLVDVDEHGRTSVAHIYAAGDVIGPPALASTSRDQGRRAVHHALGLPCPSSVEMTPVGIYTIPEMAAVGLTEAQARERGGVVWVGRARLADIARGLIAGNTVGLVKLVADGDGLLVGAHAIGEGAAELIHLAQLALQHGMSARALLDNVFNFPTLAEAYQLAAWEIVAQLDRAGVGRAVDAASPR